MALNYTVVDTALVAATKQPSYISNVRYVTGTPGAYVDADIENGICVVLKGRVPNKGDLQYATLPEVSSTTKDIRILATPEVGGIMYDESVYHPLTDFINPAGSNSVAITPQNNDEIWVTAPGFTTEPVDATVEGSFVDFDTATGKFVLSATATDGITLGFINGIINKQEVGQKMYAIKFVL